MKVTFHIDTDNAAEAAQIANLLSQLSETKSQPTIKPEEPKKADKPKVEKPVPESKPEPKPEVLQPAPEPQPQESAPVDGTPAVQEDVAVQVTRDDVKALAKTLIQSGKHKELQEAVQATGASSLGKVPEEKVGELYLALKAL